MKIIKPGFEFITPIDGKVIMERLEQCGGAAGEPNPNHGMPPPHQRGVCNPAQAAWG